jgi:four helix bundle protein
MTDQDSFWEDDESNIKKKQKNKPRHSRKRKHEKEQKQEEKDEKPQVKIKKQRPMSITNQKQLAKLTRAQHDLSGQVSAMIFNHELFLQISNCKIQTLQWILDVAANKFEIKINAIETRMFSDIVSQLQRSATSVTANIAEGEGRTCYGVDRRHHWLIARGSLLETIDHLSSLSVLSHVFDVSKNQQRNEILNLWRIVVPKLDKMIYNMLTLEIMEIGIPQSESSSSSVDTIKVSSFESFASESEDGRCL